MEEDKLFQNFSCKASNEDPSWELGVWNRLNWHNPSIIERGVL
jgi:hypothetical protein